MVRIFIIPVLLLLALESPLPTAGAYSSSVYMDKSAYKNIVVEIRDGVPVENCLSVLHNLEVSGLYRTEFDAFEH